MTQPSPPPRSSCTLHHYSASSKDLCLLYNEALHQGQGKGTSRTVSNLHNFLQRTLDTKGVRSNNPASSHKRLETKDVRSNYSAAPNKRLDTMNVRSDNSTAHKRRLYTKDVRSNNSAAPSRRLGTKDVSIN